MADLHIRVSTVFDNKELRIPITPQTTVEDACITICKQLNISTIARHLFALRTTNKQYFLKPASLFTEKDKCFDFRLRYKMTNILKLKKIDLKAYEYYFHQARLDLLENKIPEIVYEKCKKELIGLGICDMYRVMLEKDIPRETVENDYKKYIPKEVLKRHMLGHVPLFIKKPIHDTLVSLQKSAHDAQYVKAQYLNQLHNIAPEYLSETFKAFMDRDGVLCQILLKVSLSHPTEPGLRYCFDDQWFWICSIEDLGFVSIRDKDDTVEISRKNGIPFYIKFNSLGAMYSFITCLDGYYRLVCKWTFNICKDVPTPSLQKLYAMKCHGPVGGEFSYAKLEEKRANRAGCFILRESESKYNSYFIDVCLKDGLKPKTYKLELITGDEYIFNDDTTRYKTIQQLMAAYNDPNGAIYLKECLPPTEYDISPLLLCASDKVLGAALTDSSDLDNILTSNPQCINSRDLQVYKGQRKEGSRQISIVYRAMWKVTKGKKMEVAMKVLKQESYDHLKEFLDIAGEYAFLQSTAIVRLLGVTLSKSVSMILEYFPLGPLDQYLKDNKGIIKKVDLIEAASNLATALWHLKENRIVHGNIRCRKLMVYTHDENSFTIKLMDPGIHTNYASKEIHWIPIECYSNLNFAKRSPPADVWAFSTTLWEIFMYAEEIVTTNPTATMRWYASGKRLPQPPNCDAEIYQLMRECWDADPHRRKLPQAIMRDINRILYQLYNSRRTHSYAKIFSRPSGTSSAASSTTSSNIDKVPTTSSNSLNSNSTQMTFMHYQHDDLISASEIDSNSSRLTDYEGSQNLLLNSQETLNCEDSLSCDFSNILSGLNFSTATTSLDSINSMQSIFELDADYNVVLQGRIGQGFYGEVYKGMLELRGDEMEMQKVAVKKLKATALSSSLQDFEREINIMKTLQHRNIVKIMGVLREPEILLVMEFVQHGSLQSYLKIYRDALQTKQLLQYALDIAEGMEYLGKKNIVHRDLAARNILVVNEHQVKISDFGLAQVMGANDYYILKTNRELPIKWYAPESLRDGKFSVRSDVWSYGVTMCEMFNCGEEPKLATINEENLGGQEQQVLLQALESGARFPCPPMCQQVIYIRIIHPCWEYDPHARVTFSRLVEETKDLLTQY